MLRKLLLVIRSVISKIKVSLVGAKAKGCFHEAVKADLDTYPCLSETLHENVTNEPVANDTLDDIFEHYLGLDTIRRALPPTFASNHFDDSETTAYDPLEGRTRDCTGEDYCSQLTALRIDKELPDLPYPCATNVGSIESPTATSSAASPKRSQPVSTLELSTMVFELEDTKDLGDLLSADAHTFKSSNDLRVVTGVNLDFS